MLAYIFRLLLLETLAVRRVGVPLMLNGQSFMLYADVHACITDLDGIRMCLDWRGAGSIRSCFKCSNVWGKGNRCIDGHVDITCTEHDRFTPYSEELLRDCIDVISAAHAEKESGRMTATDFNELVKGMGWNFNPWGLLSDHDLRLVMNFTTVFRTDWVHNMLQRGVMTVAVHMFLQVCKDKANVDIDCWGQLMRADFHFPAHRRHTSRILADLFSVHAEADSEKDKTFKSKASELLSLFTIMRHFVDVKWDDLEGIDLEKYAFLKACDLLDLVLKIKRDPGVDLEERARELTDAWKAAYDAHLAAYGDASVLPKHHMTYHVAEQLLLDGGLLDMFIIERLNLRVKAVAEPIENTRRNEYSLLASLLTSTVNRAQDCRAMSGLEPPVRPCPQFPSVTLAARATLCGKTVSVDDFVKHNDRVLRIAACAADNGNLLVVCERYVRIEPVWSHSGTYRSTGAKEVLRVRDIDEVSAWYFEPGCVVVVD